MKELDRLSRVLQEPMLDDAQIRAMVRVDKIPMDEALKDLSAVIKLMTVEHQLTLQSLKIVSIALEKLAKRVHLAAHPDVTYTSTEVREESEADASEDHHEMVRRAILNRFRRNAAVLEERPQADDSLTLPELSSSSQEVPSSASSLLSSSSSSSSTSLSSVSALAEQQHPSYLDDSSSRILDLDEGSPVHLTDGDVPRSRQKRFLFGLGLWGLAGMYSPWLWGGYWGGYGYGNGYGYPYYGGNYYYPYAYNYPYGYYPYYYYAPTAQTPAAPAAVRRPLKKGNKK